MTEFQPEPSNSGPSHQFTCIDLGSIIYPLWHTQETRVTAADFTSKRAVEEVYRYTHNGSRVVVCCDSPRSFRAALDPSYKASRKDKDARFLEQLRAAVEALKADGFPVWGVTEMEADDVVASAVTWALGSSDDAHVLVVSADKDLLQLVGPRVTVKSPVTGNRMDAAAVFDKYGVWPHQIVDYLSLVGDAADNIKGAKSIGEKTAAKLLARFASLDAMYEVFDAPDTVNDPLMTPGVRRSLTEFKDRLPLVRTLITLRNDLPLPFSELLAERVPTTTTEEPPMPETEPLPSAPQEPTHAIAERDVAEDKGDTRPVVATPVTDLEWSRQLDPTSWVEAWRFAGVMFKSRLFSGYGSQESVFSTIIMGRSIGLDAATALRCIHVIEGRHAFSAQLVAGIIMKNTKVCEFFMVKSITEDACTVVTKRRNNPTKQTATFTLADAERAGLIKPRSNWEKYPKEMLIARATMLLARMVYPDIVANVYGPGEIPEDDAA